MPRVLCFGDSLTESYMSQESGELRHPYSISLPRLLQYHFQAATVVVDTAAVRGECVVPSMTRRLHCLLSEASEPYDWVLILGGTNDLDCGLRAEQSSLIYWVSMTKQRRMLPLELSPWPSLRLLKSWRQRATTTGERRLR